MKTLIALATLLCLLAVANAYNHHMGVCPDIEPMNGFEMEKFLGYWYVIQRTSGGGKCNGYNYTRGNGPDKYVTTQDSDRHIFGISSLKYRTHYSGNLTVPEPSRPARMEVRFPLNIAGAASYVVFATDYNNYAGIFVCQNFQISHRRNVVILSRRKELDHATLDNLHQQLENFSASGDRLSFVSQTGCDVDEDLVEIKINSNTFSKENVRKFFSKAGEKIGQVYHKMLGMEQTEHTDSESSTTASITTPQGLGENFFEEQF